MKVLIAGEFTATIRDEFRKYDIEAWSCDLKPCIKGKKYHYQCDYRYLLKPGKWDMIIMHPECKKMTVSGNKTWANTHERYQAVQDFKEMYSICSLIAEKVCLENPVGQIQKWFRKPNQYVCPTEHGDYISKKTGLWTKNLPIIKPSNIVKNTITINNVIRSPEKRSITSKYLARELVKTYIKNN